MLSRKLQHDMNSSSELLNLQVSFYWRHLANENLLNLFRSWDLSYSVSSSSSVPQFILMGLSYSLHELCFFFGNTFWILRPCTIKNRFYITSHGKLVRWGRFPTTSQRFETTRTHIKTVEQSNTNCVDDAVTGTIISSL